MKVSRPYFITSLLSYTKGQKIGLMFFFLLVLCFQFLYYQLEFNAPSNNSKIKKEWLSNTIPEDTTSTTNYTYKIYPFNPNFITDYKGYRLGMSVQEIDRLHAFRKQNKFVNSAEEFQQVTKVSDSLLNVISPYFKFPDWVKNRKTMNFSYSDNNSKATNKVILDINLATKEDLMKVYGIGDKISDRILEQRNKYGAFLDMEQMNDIWGLSEDVIKKLNESFAVKSSLGAKKININSASIKELSQFPFFRYQLAKEIVVYRSMNGDISIDDLTKIKGFPEEKIKIIALYLEF